MNQGEIGEVEGLGSNVVLVAGVQHSDSDIHIYTYVCVQVCVCIFFFSSVRASIKAC